MTFSGPGPSPRRCPEAPAGSRMLNCACRGLGVYGIGFAGFVGFIQGLKGFIGFRVVLCTQMRTVHVCSDGARAWGMLAGHFAGLNEPE